MRKKLLVCVLAVTMLITMLAGCGKAAGDNDKAAGKPIKDSLTIALGSDVAVLDQMKTMSSNDRLVISTCSDPLFRLKADGSFDPVLSESWTTSDDGLTYTFKLVKGVKFHNGEELKASDVVYTFNYAKKSPYTSLYVSQVKDIVAVDDYTVKFTLSEPFAPFLLYASNIFIVNEKAVKAAGDNYGKDNIVGTGAYKFVKHVAGESVNLERFDDYFKGKSTIKNIEFKVLVDQNATFVALQTGEIDFAQLINASTVKTAKNNANLTLTQSQGANLYFLLINNTKIKNVKLRQAMNYAIDKDSVIQMAAEGLGKKADTIINDQTFGFSKDVKGYDYNPEKAKQLLTEAGYPNGTKLTLKTIEAFKKVAEVVQENLSKIGITVNIELGEQNAVIADIMSGNYEISAFGIGLMPDLDHWDMVFNTNGGSNLCKYSNKRVDELFTQARKVLDKNERLKLYKELLQTLNDDAVDVPIYFPINTFAYNKNLKIGEIAFGIFYVQDMKWTK